VVDILSEYREDPDLELGEGEANLS
jgi:hypothetical protein